MKTSKIIPVILTPIALAGLGGLAPRAHGEYASSLQRSGRITPSTTPWTHTIVMHVVQALLVYVVMFLLTSREQLPPFR